MMILDNLKNLMMDDTVVWRVKKVAQKRWKERMIEKVENWKKIIEKEKNNLQETQKAGMTKD